MYSDNGYINVGTYNITITLEEDENYLSRAITVTLKIEKRTVGVLPSYEGGVLTYGDTLPELVCTAIITGRIKLNAGQALTAGSNFYYWTFTPDDIANNNVVTGSIVLTVEKATPTVTVKPYTAPLNFGNPLPTIQVDKASISGISNIYGTIKLDVGQTLIKGENTYTWTFTPADTANLNIVYGTIVLNVLKGVASINANNTYTYTYDGSLYVIPASTNSDGIIKPTVDGEVFSGARDAGTYIVVIFVDETDDYYAATKTVTLTINKATSIITATNASYVYDGTKRTITATANSNEMPTYSVGGEVFDGAINAGSYTVVISVPANKNYAAATRTVVLTISKATAIIEADNKTVTYNGREHGVTATTNSDGVIVYSNNNRINAGTYTITASVSATTNYTAASKSVKLIIQKATVSVVPDAISVTLRYGDALPAISTKEEGGIISFNSGQSLKVGIGDYSWTWKPSDSTNFNNVTGVISLTVLKGLAVVTAEDMIVIYDGKTKNIAATHTGDGVLTYVGNGQTDAGVYTVTVLLSETALYEGTQKDATLIINKAAPIITAANKTVVYDGQVHTINATATSDGFITTENNNKIDAGVYDVKIFVEESKNHTAAYAEVKLIINKANPVITGGNLSVDYDGTEYSLSASTNSNGVLTYINNGHTKAGVYSVQIKLEETVNYNVATAVFVLTINKANMPVSVMPYSGETLTYGDKLPEIACDNPNGTVAIDASQELTGGTNFYSWTFVPFDTENYNLIVGTIALMVEKANRELSEHVTVEVTHATAKSITITFVEDAEYSLDGENWQKSNVFKGLVPNTDYTVYVRLAENQNFYTSPEIAMRITTAKGFTIELLVIIILGAIVTALVAGFGIFTFSKTSKKGS